MEQIVADKCVNDAKTLIQTSISYSSLSDEVKNKLAELYDSINQNNAQNVYLQANSLVDSELRKAHHEFNMGWLKVTGSVFLVGVAVSGLSYLGYRYTRFTGFFETGMKIGGGIAFLGFCGVMAIGH